MRVTTLLNELLDLPGVTVSGVVLQPGQLLVDVRLRAKKLACPHCAFTTRARYDTRPAASSWRHLDFGAQLCSSAPICAGSSAPNTGSWLRPSRSPATGPGSAPTSNR